MPAAVAWPALSATWDHKLRWKVIETCCHHPDQGKIMPSSGMRTSPYAVPHHCSSWLRFPSTSFCREPVCSCEACWPSLETSCSLTCSQQEQPLAQRLLGRTLLGSAAGVAGPAYAAADGLAVSAPCLQGQGQLNLGCASIAQLTLCLATQRALPCSCTWRQQAAKVPTWKPLVLAVDLKVSTTRLNRVTENRV